MSDSASSKALHIESIFSISHDKDVDGLNAAAIVLRYARSKDLNHEVLLADYGAFEIIFSQVAVLRNALIIVTDLGMDDSVLEVIKSSLERAISQGCRLVWLDHHQWSEQAIKTILSLDCP
ncbi:MAG: DHH family phosphoesterase [Candidatus Thorarchaeota archaeon]|jgi:oligoribonuclease NrnB/cAMP/cGMP phosphodiesterase (DHH superfamily)